MGNIYVMSDVCGHLTRFIKLLRLIRFTDEDQMLILGNVVNGGPQPLEFIEFLQGHSENIRMCLGLAEMVMIKSLLENDFDVFTQWSTHYAGKMIYDKYRTLPELKQHQILNFLKEAPSFFLLDGYFLSHGGMKLWEEGLQTNLKTEKPKLEELMKKGTPQEFVLTVDPTFYQKPGLDGHTIVFGNTPVQLIRGQPKNYSIWFDPIYEDKIGINSHIHESGHLSCLRLNDMKEFYL
jgi:serine/threonine protein phosphatase 1